MLTLATRLSLIAACAGFAVCSNAHAEEPILAPDALHRAPTVAHVYINVRTGERTISSTPTSTRSEMLPRFVNADTASNGNYFYGLDSPAASELEAVNWGDIPYDSTVDAFSFAYSTNILAPTPGPFVPGLAATLWWCDCDDGRNDPNAVPLWSFTVPNLAGVPAGGNGQVAYIYTLDLEGSGFEFEIGDTDGSFVGYTGQSSTGCGNTLADFSWSYRFHQGQTTPIGTIGPALALPDPSLGVPDVMDLFLNPGGTTHESYVRSVWFGGWPVAPYASTYMGLYGSNSRDCGPADFNADTIVDILDFLDFIDDFSNCEGQPAPCGSIGNTDLGGDTIVDILDFLDFFDVFSACE